MRWRPTFHRISTHRLGAGLLRRPEAQALAIVIGPVSILWDRSFKRAEAARQ